uniref:Ubiquinone biosynthesis O-methyltransferase, mitochondrial n=1 Tax=Phallusia mammillata TaxID=59560 RepID=A0A6F9D6Q4_9ASCI|nr:arsenite methyltransferase-like [Phallusia mammillata]
MSRVCKLCGHCISKNLAMLQIRKISKRMITTYLRDDYPGLGFDQQLPKKQRTLFDQSMRFTSSSSVSEEETKKFSKLAHSWWDERGDMMALHTMNSLRVPFIRDCLLYQGFGKPKTAKALEGVNILEVGCGAGILSEPLARLGASVVGIDSSAEALEAAKIHRGDDEDLQSLQYLDSWLEDIVAVGSIKFDCVVASEVIEHVEDYRNFIQMCNKVLKPGGSLFISTMNRTNYSYYLGIIMAEYVLHVVSPGTHTWDKFLKPAEIEDALLNEGCPLVKIHGMCYDPIRNKWSWTSSTELNYIVHAVKTIPTASENEKETKTLPESSKKENTPT